MVERQLRGLQEAGMESLIRTCVNEARAIRETVGQVSSAMGNTWWRGDDALRFRESWNSHHRRRNLQLAEELESLARRLREQLARQRNASGR